MDDLERYFLDNRDRRIDKWMHYFQIYDRHFSRFRNRDINVLEIGVLHGGSLQMWKQYFGPGAHIYGIDINPKCKSLEEERINIFIGSQSDAEFLRSVKTLIPPIDILIDDGGHTMKQQRTAFEQLFDHVKDDGVYLIEDLHTSYWLRYGGGHKRMGTFIEYSKTLIDRLNAWHSHQRSLRPDSLTSALESLHFYDSVLVIEKKHRERPIERTTGGETIEVEIPAHLRSGNYLAHPDLAVLLSVNSLLRFLRLPSFRL